MQFVFSPVLGALSDRFGRRPVVLLSNLGLGLDYVLMAMAPSLGWLFVGRLVSGITSATFSTAAAYIADVTPPEGGPPSSASWAPPSAWASSSAPPWAGCWGTSTCACRSGSPACSAWPTRSTGSSSCPSRSPATAAPAACSGTWPTRWARWPCSARARCWLGLAATAILYFLAHEALPSLWVLYTTYRYDFSERLTGVSLAAVGLGSTVVSAALVGPAVRWMGERRALLVGLLFGALGFAFYGAASSSLLFFLGIPLTSLWGLAGPAVQSMMSREVGPSQQGQLQGAISSMRGITGMVGPLLFTQVFALTIDGPPSTQLPGAAYLLAALLVAASIVVAALVSRRLPPPAASSPAPTPEAATG